MRKWIGPILSYSLFLISYFLFLHHFRSAYPVVQGFAEEGSEKEIDDGYTRQAS